MTRTPWGDATELRERMLRPGRGTPREEAEKNQRERLFAAMVATVADKGYEATTVADLVNLSGVSRSAFYRHFDDKEECFLTAAEALIEPTLGAIRAADGEASGDDRTRQALEAFLRPDREPAGRLEDVLRRGLRGRPRRRSPSSRRPSTRSRASSPSCSRRSPAARGCRSR